MKRKKIQKELQEHLSKVDWYKVGTYSAAVVIVVASQGILGRKAKYLSLALLGYIGAKA